MHHHHGHDHGHPPGPDAGGQGRAFLTAIGLNAGFVVAEFGFGFVANSTALMADAGHNLADVLGLVLAWGAALLAGRAPNGRFTYGLRGSTILAALANAMLLLVACGAIAWEAAGRFLAPPVVAAQTVIWVAGFGILINGLSAWLFLGGSRSDLNVRGAFLHMVADTAVSLGVVIGALAMIRTGWYWLDPLISLVILAVILVSTWGLLRDSLHLALNAVPPQIDVEAVADYLRGCPGVAGIHDLHIWGMSTTESALTVHLVVPDGDPGYPFLASIAATLQHRFAIQHSTLQVERTGCEPHCTLQG